ncbi:MAG: hypothetical protein QNK23_10130 [Crocinitomicaceae bacterium]|nr:hypothetical protein [Crocinitomicaceae bacterium]
MKYFPKHDVIFTSTLSDDELVDRLTVHLEPKKHRGSHWIADVIMVKEEDPPYFEGTIHNYFLEIKRISGQHGLFAPEIGGRIKQNALNTTAKLEFRLNSLTSAILAIGFMLSTFVTIISVYEMFTRGFSMSHLIMMIIWAGSYMFVVLVFKASVDKDVRVISNIFNAEPEYK